MCMTQTFPQDVDERWRYQILLNNCQDYVADVIERAEVIARKRGIPLIIQ